MDILFGYVLYFSLLCTRINIWIGDMMPDYSPKCIPVARFEGSAHISIDVYKTVFKKYTLKRCTYTHGISSNSFFIHIYHVW